MSKRVRAAVLRTRRVSFSLVRVVLVPHCPKKICFLGAFPGEDVWNLRVDLKEVGIWKNSYLPPVDFLADCLVRAILVINGGNQVGVEEKRCS